MKPELTTSERSNPARSPPREPGASENWSHEGLPKEPPPANGSIPWLRRAHAEQLDLCRELELIADSLPGNINRQKCIYAAKALGPLIRGTHRYEEQVFFPWLRDAGIVAGGAAGAAMPLDQTFERLRFEHFEDECFAEELTDALLRLGAGQPVNMEAIGYMLRGFFESVRRHIAFESELIARCLPDGGPTGTS